MSLQSQFNFEAPAQRHSQTSVEAARQVKGIAAAQRAEVFAFILNRGELGSTDEECQQGLTMQGSSQRPRRCELVASGVVVDSGQTRITTSGRKAVVWKCKSMAGMTGGK